MRKFLVGLREKGAASAARAGVVLAGAAAASSAFAFETGLDGLETTVDSIIGIGVAITLAIVTFVVGRRVVNRL